MISKFKSLFNDKGNHIFLLLTVMLFILFFNLSNWGVTETSEARYAEIAREMYVSGDYMHPRLLKIGHYHKPPFTYWVTATAYHIFGVSTFSVRFFLQLAVLTQILLVYKIGQRLFKSDELSLLASIIYASFPGVIISARALTTDAYLASFVLLFIWAWLEFKNSGRLGFLFLAYAALGLGFLTKGPVVFIIPVMVAIGINSLYREHKSGWLYHLIGTILMCVIGLTWYIKLYLYDNQFLNYFILDHTINRFATNSFGRSQPFWFYLLIVPITAFPWFFISMKMIKRALKKAAKINLLFLLWIIAPLLFFSISSSKLILYVLPIYAGIALAATYYLIKLKHRSQRLWGLIFVLFTVMVSLALSLSPMFDIQLHFTPFMYIIVLLIPLVIILIFKSGFRTTIQLPLMSFAFNGLLTVFSSCFFGQHSMFMNDQRPLATYIENNFDASSVIYVYDELLPSLAFHLQRDVITINDGNRHLNRETQFETNEKWKQNWLKINSARLYNKLHSSEKAIIITSKSDTFPEKPNEFILIKTIGEWSVYTK